MSLDTISVNKRKAQDQKFYAQQRQLLDVLTDRGIDHVDNIQFSNFNLLKTINHLKKIQELIVSSVDDLYTQLNIINDQYSRGVITKEDLEEKKIIIESKKARLLTNHSEIVCQFDELFIKRKGLSFNYPTYENNQHRIENNHQTLYFLDQDYSGLMNEFYLFGKVANEEHEYNKLTELLLGYHEVDDIIEALSRFLNCSPNQVALAGFTPVYQGFAIWLHSDNLAVKTQMQAMAECFNEIEQDHIKNHIRFNEQDAAWIVGGVDGLRTLAKSDVILNLPIWVDIHQPACYAAMAVQPIKYNLSVGAEEYSDLNYLKLIEFDYTEQPIKINRCDVIEIIQRKHAAGSQPTNLSIHNAKKFTLFSMPCCWTFSTQILLRYNIGRKPNVIILKTSDLSVVFAGALYHPLSTQATEMFINTLHLLRIAGVITINPSMLLEDHSCPIEHLQK